MVWYHHKPAGNPFPSSACQDALPEHNQAVQRLLNWRAGPRTLTSDVGNDFSGPCSFQIQNERAGPDYLWISSQHWHSIQFNLLWSLHTDFQWEGFTLNGFLSNKGGIIKPPWYGASFQFYNLCFCGVHPNPWVPG